MEVRVNGQSVQVEETSKIRVELPGTDWAVTYYGHRETSTDVVIDRH